MKMNHATHIALPLVIFLLLCSCATHYGDKEHTDALPPAVLSEEEYSIDSYNVDVQGGYFWLLCASDKFYYTSGVQEQMDNASRVIKVYSYDPANGNIEAVPLPYSEGWHLYTMTPDGNGGFWMVFTPQKASSVNNYIAGPAYLVKTDSNYRELFTIDMTPYTEPQVTIMGHQYPQNSEYTQELMEEMTYLDVVPNNFDTPALVCDNQGRVYITAVNENIIVFDSDGGYLGQFDTFDPDYMQGVYLTKTYTGEIVVGRCNADNKLSLTVINADDFSQGEHMIQETSQTKSISLSPTASLLPKYDLFGSNYYGLYGIQFNENGKYTCTPLLYYGENTMPYDVYGKLREDESGARLVFEHRSDVKDDGTKDFIFYSLEMNIK